MTAGLLDVRALVRFRHPLLRSAIYRSAGLSELREIHRVLAEVTDPDLDPDRRARHLARATLRPDESVAAELESFHPQLDGQGPSSCGFSHPRSAES